MGISAWESSLGTACVKTNAWKSLFGNLCMGTCMQEARCGNLCASMPAWEPLAPRDDWPQRNRNLDWLALEPWESKFKMASLAPLRTFEWLASEHSVTYSRGLFAILVLVPSRSGARQEMPGAARSQEPPGIARRTGGRRKLLENHSVIGSRCRSRNCPICGAASAAPVD